MPENDHPPYNPRERQPQSLGELEHWMRAAEAAQRAGSLPFPVSLNPPPIAGLDRLSAHCAAKYGQTLCVDAARRMIGEYALARDVSTDQARAAPLQDAADTLAPRVRTTNLPPPGTPPDPRNPAEEGGTVGTSNPLHTLIEQLGAFLNTLWRHHQAATGDDRDRAQKAWRALTGPFWATHRIRAEAVRAFADPALAWCSRRGPVAQDHVAAIKNAAALLSALAASHPCAVPSVYANPEEAQLHWDRQGELLLGAQAIVDGLREVAALSGVEWKWDGCLPWDVAADETPSMPRPEQTRPSSTGGLVDTRPDCPLPPEPRIEAAMRDVPRTMADMDNTAEYGAPSPAPGQRIVLRYQLLGELGERHGHGKAAAEWAIHRLAEQGLLTARYGRSALPMYQTEGGVWGGGGDVEVRELRLCLLASTPNLWDWWRELETRQAANGRSERANDAPPAANRDEDPLPDRGSLSLAERVRTLMDRLTAANERFLRATLRLQATPGPSELVAALPQNRNDRPLVLRDVLVPCEEGLSVDDLWGAARLDTGTGQIVSLFSLVKGGEQGDEAAGCFTTLAAESGRLYQTLPTDLAPVYGTTSPRNLWATVLFAGLRGTPWVREAQDHEFIPQPFAASVELWRRLLYGTTPDGKVGAGSSPASPVDPRGTAAQEIERANHLHRLAVRCVNAVLALDAERYYVDGEGRARTALAQLGQVVAQLPELPLHDDPFCGDDIVELAGVTATSAHAAAFAIARRTWQAAHLQHLAPEDATDVREKDGTSYTRVTQKVVRCAPTGVEWSGEIWAKIRDQLGNHPALDPDKVHALFALEHGRAGRRLESRSGTASDGSRGNTQHPPAGAALHPEPAASNPTESQPGARQRNTEASARDQRVPRQGLKEPSKDAITAYRASLVTGKTQTELVSLLTRELKRPVHQGTISRWIRQVKKWIEAGNVLPDLGERQGSKPMPMDPGRIDLGERQDGRPAHKRGRRKSQRED